MIKVGIENLNEHLDLFKGKRVGLITNPTGMDQLFNSTIDILKKQTNLVSLFSPEHGVRGNIQAGVKLDPYIDEKTGCMVYSLYGETRRPTKEMMDEIDLLCFDIQDVGARFYTFLYTMTYAMEACQMYQKQMVVFDRPNPLGGVEVEGNLLNLDYRSFVGYYETPQRYGLTIGEFARFVNDHYQIGCDLTVIPMTGYKRGQHYDELGLPFIAPSPNIPTSDSIYAYLATCIFEGTNLSEGRGTTKPFQYVGAPWLDAEKTVTVLNELQLPGVKFRAHYFTPMFSKNKDLLCAGIELHITDKKAFKPVSTGIHMLYAIKDQAGFEYLMPPRTTQKPFINLLLGDGFFTTFDISKEALLEKIKQDSDTFKQQKERYHLYEV
jgi:uncharacterized protein YbbC (DUF1343 family)